MRRRKFSFESLEQRRLLAVGPITLETFGPGFDSPVVATHAGDGSGRLFVAEQDGQIFIVRDGELVGQPFLDLSDRLITGGASGERGLLGLAFHPDYDVEDAEGQGKFYVYYSAPAFISDHDSVIAEYQVSDTNPDVADILSHRTVLRFSQPFSNHNGGDLKFGPDDGLLYISSGDGGSGSDPFGNGQNAGNLLGAILRVDVSGDDFPNDATRNYAIPPTNPFVDNIEARDEVFATGLRNPFRMSFDDGPDAADSPDRLFVGDVGQSTFEEVNLVTAGGNYGWNVCEGDHLFNQANLACPDGFEPPIAEYGRQEGISVIGGFVYRGSASPSLKGVYLFGDFTGGLMALEEQADGSFVRTRPVTEGSQASTIIGFGEDESGEMYVLTLSGLLAISAVSDPDPVVAASGEVLVSIDGFEIVVADSSGERFRSRIAALNSLTLTLSASDDRVSLPNFEGSFDVPLNIEGGDGTDTIRLLEAGHDINRVMSTDLWFNIEVFDVAGTGANQLTLDRDSVISASTSTDTLRVVHDADDVIEYGDGWSTAEPTRVGGQFFHRLTQDTAIVEIINSLPFQNPLTAQDVNRDRQVTSRDALQIINALGTRRGELENDPRLPLADPYVYFDVSGDGMLTALDALRVINQLGRQPTSEGESLKSLRWRVASQIEPLPTDRGDFDSDRGGNPGREDGAANIADRGQ
ncbi:MAG: PQQ-dependent sugar dehydrogenase [Rubripirellula sp.]